MKLTIFAFLALISFANTKYSSICNGQKKWQIESGDSFYSLALNNWAGMCALLNANPGVDPCNLQAGQTVKCPSFRTSTKCASEYFAYSCISDLGEAPSDYFGTGLFGTTYPTLKFAGRRYKRQTYNCNGVVYTYPYPGCAYNPVSNGTESVGSPIDNDTTYYSCNGFIYTYPFPDCTYLTDKINNIFYGITNNNSTAIIYYSCNGVLYPYAYPGCTYHICNGIHNTYPYSGCTYSTTSRVNQLRK